MSQERCWLRYHVIVRAAWRHWTRAPSWASFSTTTSTTTLLLPTGRASRASGCRAKLITWSPAPITRRVLTMQKCSEKLNVPFRKLTRLSLPPAQRFQLESKQRFGFKLLKLKFTLIFNSIWLSLYSHYSWYRRRNPFHLQVLGSLYITTLKPPLCKQLSNLCIHQFCVAISYNSSLICKRFKSRILAL